MVETTSCNHAVFDCVFIHVETSKVKLVIGFYRELLIKCIESEENGRHDNDSNDRKASLDLLHTEQRGRIAPRVRPLWTQRTGCVIINMNMKVIKINVPTGRPMSLQYTLTASRAQSVSS